MVSSWRHVVSLVPEWKTHPNPTMTQHIRECSRNPPHPKVWNGAGALASPPPMLKHKTVVYFPFPHQWCSIVFEWSSSKNCITQWPVHQFVTLIDLLVPTWHKSPPEVIWEHALVQKQWEDPKGTPIFKNSSVSWPSSSAKQIWHWGW